MKKKIIIIGGSKGIGRATVQALLPNFEVVSISRSSAGIQEEGFSEFNLDVLKDDLPDIDRVDGLVYCPGSINLKPINRLSEDDFKEDFEINVLGAVRAIQHFLPKLKDGKDPAIVMFSTVAVKLGMPFHASVATSKAGVEGLVKSLGAELAPTVRVNAIAPTVTNTELASKLLRNDRQVENMNDRHPLKRFLEPEEVANMAAFLLSDNAKSLTGQVFEMDCGIVSLKI